MLEFRVRPLNSFPAKLIGLIGAPRAYPVFFSTRWGIHTFGVRFPIDVLILDDHYCVVKIAKNLQPNNIFFWPPRYRFVVELPAGTITAQAIKINHFIKLKNI